MTEMTPREWRREFTRAYGNKTATAVKLMFQGYKSHAMAQKMGTSMMTAAAYRANLTRGMYFPYAYKYDGTVVGELDYAPRR